MKTLPFITLAALALPVLAQEPSATPLTDALKARDREALSRLTGNCNPPLDCESFLETAAMNGRVDTVRQLLAEGHNPDSHVDGGFTPLQRAARRYPHIVELLVEAGADVNAPVPANLHLRHQNSFALWEAVESSNTYTVRYLLSKGAIPQTGMLHKAVKYQNPQMCQLLLEAGCDPDALYQCDEVHHRMTSLMTAIYSKEFSECNPEIVRMLLAAGADVNATTDAFDLRGLTALHFAARNGAHAETNIPLLLEAGADLEERDKDGNTPLMLAVRNGNYAAAKVLLEKGADPRAMDAYGNTLVIKAALGDSLPVMALVLELGVDANTANAKGRTALMLAAMSGEKPELVALLLSKGSDVRAKDKTGRTALHYAVEAPRPFTRTVAVLLAAGADPDAKDNNGDTASDLATRKHREFLLPLIDSYRKGD